MSDPVSAAIIIGSGITKEVGAVGQAQQEDLALQEQASEAKVQANQQALVANERLERLVSAQVAQGAASGFTINSGDFAAIQTDTFNKFEQDKKGRDLTLQLREDAIKQQRANVKSGLILDSFKNIFEAASSFATGPFGTQSNSFNESVNHIFE